MSEAEPKVDISFTRPMTGIPSTVNGLIVGPNTIVAQDVTVSPTFPGAYVVTVSGGVDIINISPNRGQIVEIDNQASAKDIQVTPLVAPNGALVLAGSYVILIADGTKWHTVPDAAGGGASGPTFTSALVRGAKNDANVASLAAFPVAQTGAGQENITYVQGDFILLGKQTAVAENGPYVVGAVVAGNAPLTRPPWWATGSTIPSGFEINIGNEGAIYGGLKAVATCVGGKIVSTDDPIFMLRSFGMSLNSTTRAYRFSKGFSAAVTRNGAGDWTFPTTGGLADMTKYTFANAVNQATGQVTFDIVSVSATAVRIQSEAIAALTDVDFFTGLTLVP